jgi:glutamyl-tRNA(Gln) amidotransferase subunit E
MNIDYSKIGLKSGLEIHQQLNTATKLFCSCKPDLFKEEPEITFLRRLRPTQSELGQIDPAAFFEFQKGIKIIYEANGETACLVEMDEEPPHDLNRDAVEIALTVALMIGAKPLDEIHVMRKTVIDGSNTTGFQRTCVVALNGEINVEGKRVPIQHIGIEEDAARKMEEDGTTIKYRIDRLGIPLIEIATAPVIYSPQEAEKIALAIGRILRATGKVKRGLGTIRQDINISIRDGALTEIKGVQELELVSKVVEYEVQRQLNLLKIRDALKKIGVLAEDVKDEIVDAASVFSQTSCRVIREALEQNKRVWAVKLPKFSGLLKIELMPGVRFGKELADIAHFWGRIGGIFHTDELPAYGISAEEVDQLRRFIKTEPQDAIVFVVATKENATDALKAVTERVRKAIRSVPEETRGPNPDGTTRYMRPRPGAARMYPETDVPPIQITEEYLGDLRVRLPEMPEEKMKHLTEEYGLNAKLAKQVLDSEYAYLFEAIAKETKVSPTVIAAALTETMKAVKREGVETDIISDEQIREIFRLIDSGEAAKEAIPNILSWLAQHEGATVKEAIKNLCLAMISREELETMIGNVVEENKILIQKKGSGAVGTLMGLIMEKVRGKAEANMVSEILKRKLEEAFK